MLLGLHGKRDQACPSLAEVGFAVRARFPLCRLCCSTPHQLLKQCAGALFVGYPLRCNPFDASYGKWSRHAYPLRHDPCMPLALLLRDGIAMLDLPVKRGLRQVIVNVCFLARSNSARNALVHFMMPCVANTLSKA